MSKKSGVGKLLTGVGIGLGLGFLFAPKAGEETRKELKAKLDEMVNRVKNMDSEEVKAKIEAKVAEIKKELDELDKDWRKCNYVKKLSLLPRIIKTNKKLINLYVNIASIKYARRTKWKQENTYHIY